jgi:hypothetical protein
MPTLPARQQQTRTGARLRSPGVPPKTLTTSKLRSHHSHTSSRTRLPTYNTPLAPRSFYAVQIVSPSLVIRIALFPPSLVKVPVPAELGQLRIERRDKKDREGKGREGWGKPLYADMTRLVTLCLFFSLSFWAVAIRGSEKRC